MGISRYSSQKRHAFSQERVFCCLFVLNQLRNSAKPQEMLPNASENDCSGLSSLLGGYGKRKKEKNEIMRWHLKSCSAFSAEECKHVVLLAFITDFRKAAQRMVPQPQTQCSSNNRQHRQMLNHLQTMFRYARFKALGPRQDTVKLLFS